jgi:hypothetical protein
MVSPTRAEASPEEKGSGVDVLRRAWITCAALLLSLLVYAAVILWVSPAAPPPLEQPALVGALALVAAAIGAASLAIRALLVVRPVRTGELDPTREPDAQRLFALSVVGWMLADTVAVLGLLAFFLLHARTAALGFVAGGAALLLLQAPRLGALRPPPTSQDLARRPGPL